MDLSTLSAFFGWCTAIDGALLLLWSLAFLAAPDWLYRTQTHFVKLERATYDALMYGLIGGFKLLFLLFNLVPYLALRLVA